MGMTFVSQVHCVHIPEDVYRQIMAYVQFADGEISMLGLVEDYVDGPKITEVFLLEQTCSSAHTDLDPDAMGKLMFELAKRGVEKQLRAWVHSHASMSVFWSKTDDTCVDEYKADPYLVSLVFNKQRDVRARVDWFHPYRITLDQVPVKIDYASDKDLEKTCKEEVKTKVKELPSFPQIQTLYSGKGSSQPPAKKEGDSKSPPFVGGDGEKSTGTGTTGGDGGRSLPWDAWYDRGGYRSGSKRHRGAYGELFADQIDLMVTLTDGRTGYIECMDEAVQLLHDGDITAEEYDRAARFFYDMGLDVEADVEADDGLGYGDLELDYDGNLVQKAYLEQQARRHQEMLASKGGKDGGSDAA